MADEITPDNAVAFFSGLPRRVNDVVEALDDEHHKAVKAPVMAMVDQINVLVHEIMSVNYQPDNDLAQAAAADRLDPELAELLRTACTEAARWISGVGQWKEPETRDLLSSIDQTVSDLGAELRQLRTLTENEQQT